MMDELVNSIRNNINNSRKEYLSFFIYNTLLIMILGIFVSLTDN